MKKTTLSVFVLAGLTASAQLPVSQTPTTKGALIEEFTGYKCTYCPDGHKICDQIVNGNPTKVFGVNVHAGSYATPSSGAHDFRTPDGNAIIAIPAMKVAGFPAGDVNRAPCTNPQTAGGITMSRGSWQAAVNSQLTKNAYVNIAGQATLNTSTRQLTVNIEAYYTANGTASNYLTVMLLQDNYLGQQTGGSTYYPAMMVGSQYKHNKILRDVISNGATGELMGSTAQGYKYTKTITYTVPTTYVNTSVVLNDLKLIAFVSESSTDIVNVCKIPITQGTTATHELDLLMNNLNVFPNPASEENVNVHFFLMDDADVSMTLTNMVGQTVMSKNLGTLSPGEHAQTFNPADLQSGIYMVTIIAGGEKITQKITIE